MNAILTIAIPTYNRAAKLQAQLERLLPQLTAETRCCVYDNASTDATQMVVEKFQSPYLTCTSAPCNGGGGRNFLRCFEECQTEWLWILSDDDVVSPTAVADLLALLPPCQADFIHTSTHFGNYTADITIGEVAQLLTQATGCSLLWIPAGIYRVPAFRPLMIVFADSLSTWASHWIVVMGLLERQKKTVLLTRTNLVVSPAWSAPRWPSLDFIIRFSLAPEFLQSQKNQALMAQCIYSQFYHGAMLLGLREVHDRATVQRWQRIRHQSRRMLKAYGARSPVWDIIYTNQWHRAGNRITALTAVHHALMILILSWCPAKLFLPVLKWLPKPRWGWELLNPKDSTASLVREL